MLWYGSQSTIKEPYTVVGGTLEPASCAVELRRAHTPLFVFKQFAGMSFHLGHHAPLPLPASSLLAEDGVITPHMIGRTADGTLEWGI